MEEEIKSFEVFNKKVAFNSTNLLKAQKDLLSSIQSHIDDCFHILKAITPPPNLDEFNSNVRRSMERSPYQWLIHTNSKQNVLEFKNNIGEYKFFIDSIVNKLKHEHRRLRDIININTFEKRIGYFVEGSGVDEQGNVFVGPDRDIHPNDVPFSYSRDLAFHLYNIYEISYHLKNTLIKLYKNYYNIDLIENFYFYEDPTDMKVIINKIFKLNLRFFSKEYRNPVPIVEWDQNLNTLFLSLDKEFKLNNDFFDPKRFVVTWTPDSTTKTFRWPRG